MSRSKYNVDSNTANRTCDGVIFDSRQEMLYYRDVLKPLVDSGEVTEYELQKKYVLQPGFVHDGKKILPITYIADFWMRFKDGHEKVVEVKGFADQKAPIKRKMFYYVYPDIELVWMKYVVKFGGWITDEEYKVMKRKEKKEKAV